MNLPHLATIKQSVWVPDEFAGADYDDPDPIAIDEPCWVQPASDMQKTEFQRRSQSVSHKIYFSRNLGIKPGYYVLPTTGPFAGTILSVKSVNEATAGTGMLWRVMVDETQAR